MEKKRYYFSSFPTDYLLALLEQDSKKLTLLQSKFIEHSNEKELYERIVYLKTLVRLIRECIITRYLDDNISLNKCGKMIIESNGVKQEILKDVFTKKIIEKDELIELEVLSEVIDILDIEHLSLIIEKKEDTIYSSYATKRFDKMIFEVDEEIKMELEKKIQNDKRG